MQLPPFLLGAGPTPPIDHPRQLDGCPGGSPSLLLFRTYIYTHESLLLLYLFRTNLVSYCLFD